MNKILLLISLSLIPSLVMSQSPSPYAGEETRAIKSLSQKEIDNYLNGRGMGYAKVAELNHFPGPKHVLELAGVLALSETQMERTTELFEAMQLQAVSYGHQLVEQERALDRAFADQSINEASLESRLQEIAVLQARIRQAHLAAHIRQKALLSPQQLLQYDQHRGYSADQEQGHEHTH